MTRHDPYDQMRSLLPHLKVLASRSDCDKIQYGAVIIQPTQVIPPIIVSEGWNHNPTGVVPSYPGTRGNLGFDCKRDCVGGIRKGVVSGTCLERCYAVHAEQAAILDLPGRAEKDRAQLTMVVAGWLDRPEGKRLFDNSHGFYCTFCARLTIKAGIGQVVLFDGEGNPIFKTARKCWEESYGQLRDEPPPTLLEMMT